MVNKKETGLPIAFHVLVVQPATTPPLSIGSIATTHLRLSSAVGVVVHVQGELIRSGNGK